MNARIKNLIKQPLFQRTLAIMLIQASGQLVAFLTAIILARHLQVAEYGQYIFGITLATIIAVIATFGADGVLARTWGWSEHTKDVYQRNQQVFHTHNWYWFRGIGLLVTCLIAMLLIHHVAPIAAIERYAIIFALPFFIANLLQSFFIGTKRGVWANAIQLGLRLIMFAVVAIGLLVITTDQITGLIMIMLIATSGFVCLIWARATTYYGVIQRRPSGSNVAFMLLKWGNLLISQIDIILVRLLSNSDQVAFYGVALQLNLMVAFVLNAVSANIMAQIAHDFKHLTKTEFQHRIYQYTKLIVALSAVALGGMVSVGYWVTQLYGSAYVMAYWIFCVLAVGQLVNILCGNVFTIFNMAGFEKLSCRVFYTALAINLIFGWGLFWPFGVFGIAMASVIAMIYWNIHLVLLVKQKIHINPTIFFRA